MKSYFITTLVLAFTLGSSHQVHAIAPPYIPDEELGAYPIIVVAKWDKAPAKSHNQYRDDKDLGQVVIKSEVYTKLNILEVLKGDIEPGSHDLMLGWGITWQEDGTFVNSGTSTQLLGDVDDVKKPCLWFLKRTRSWDEKRKITYLSVSNYREIQPLALQDFYKAVSGSDAATRVPRLLKADSPAAAKRVLRYICGGIWPWPYDYDSFYDQPDRRGRLLKGESDRLWEFIQSDADEGMRRLAVSVFAELTGEDGTPNMRTLLHHDDAIVRGIAVGVLARRRDEVSLDRFLKAVDGLEDAWVGCQIIETLTSWNDERVVPAIISFLQNGNFAYRIGDDLGIPALKARQALKQVTGHVFPFDVNKSQEAWQRARTITERKARLQFLEQTVPGSEAPLVAQAVGLPRKQVDEPFKELIGELGEDEVVITIHLINVSSRPVSLLKYPSEVEMSWPAGLASRGGTDGNFMQLHPGDSTSFEVMLYESFLRAERDERRIRLTYSDNGQGKGLQAWIGAVDVTFGTLWKGKREIQQVEETWPNGNLKAVGTLVNGHKHGEWNYFNKEGDRIRIEYPGTGRGTAICNPQHYRNKRAGIRTNSK